MGDFSFENRRDRCAGPRGPELTDGQSSSFFERFEPVDPFALGESFVGLLLVDVAEPDPADELPPLLQPEPPRAMPWLMQS
jgi:hypothetical protein